MHKPVNIKQQSCIGCGRYYFRVHDLDSHFERVRRAGPAAIAMSGIHSSALLRRFWVRDPDGLMIFLAETAEGAPLDPW